jgi:exo-1,4-beta-D-glucosaminidase
VEDRTAARRRGRYDGAMPVPVARPNVAAGMLLLWALSCLLTMPARSDDSLASGFILLHEGWLLQSSEKAGEDGARISTTAFQPARWYATSVPTTVLAALVDNKVYPDPYFGMNLASLPGAGYSRAAGMSHPEHNFSNVPMPADSPFRSSWWFRKEFHLAGQSLGQRVWLHFDGINFRANVWLNGRAIATSTDAAGAWRFFEFDVTDIVVHDKLNILAVEVYPPQPNDLAISWVDWNPAPPDKNTGLWRDVYLTTTGPVAVRWPHVVSRFPSPSFDSARLTVTAELCNATSNSVRGVLHGQIGDTTFSKQVELGAKETRVAGFSPGDYPQLTVQHPHLWWPAKLGAQYLYEIKLWFEINGTMSDTKTAHFGIREVGSELNENGARIFKINGKRILIRGAGWAPDMLLRASPKRQEAEIAYVADMNLNTIRLEGKLEDENFLNLCDRRGVLVMAGWCCCDHWEKWNNWKPEDFRISAESLRDQIRRLRIHPSVFDWLNGSDYAPPPKVEETYVRILKELDWPNPYQSSASQAPSSVSGVTGLKMTGPYEYVPPVYWSTDHSRGGAFGFNTETGPGAAIPPVDSLRKFLPPEHLWPIDDYWTFHAGRDVPSNLDVYTRALSSRYGRPANLEDFVGKSEVSAYEGERAMFEAYAANKYNATGVIQWMLNNSWPSVIWHLYDYYLHPGGGYFGTKKACEPLHIQYSYDDRSIVVVNTYYRNFERLTARARVYDLNMQERYSNSAAIDAGSDSVTKAFAIPAIPQSSGTYFLRLDLSDASGKEVTSNFYWLSQEPDVMDWEKGDGYYTPEKSFADFSELRKLPPVKLKVSAQYVPQGTNGSAQVTVDNPSTHLAFAIHLRVVNSGDGEELLPVQWEDNFFSLLPGERRSLTASYALPGSATVKPDIRLDGWNVSQER